MAEMIETLKNTVSAQAVEINQLKREKDKQAAMITRLQDEARSLVNDDQMKSNCADFQLRIQKLEGQIQKSERERTDLQVRCNELQSSYDKSAKKIKDLETELESKENLDNAIHAKFSGLQSHHKQQQKVLSDKFKEEIEAKNKTIKELEEKISMFEKTLENASNKTVSEKDAEIQKLIAKHEQEMKAAKAKFENEAKKSKSEKDALKSKVENLSEKVSEEQKAATKFKKETKDLKKKITVTKENEKKLRSEIDDLKQKLREARAVPNNQLEQENYSPVFFALDDVRDGSKIDCSRFLGNKNVVVKVAKLVSGSDRLCKLYSNPNKKPVIFDPNSEESCFQLQVNGELKIKSEYVDQLIQRIHSFAITKLDLGGTYLDCHHFMKFVSAGKVKTFICNDVTYCCGIDKIMKQLPNFEVVYFRHLQRLHDCQKLAELPVFKNLKKFNITPVGRSFDINDFVGFIKKHPNVEFIFKLNLLTQKGRNDIREREEQFRELLPSNCKVVIEY